MKPVEVNVNFLYHLETSENHINGLNNNNIGESGTI